jgi:hypothetical protein
MNRKLLRATLIGLVLLAATATVWPALSSAVGLKLDWGSQTKPSGWVASSNGACANKGVTVVVDFGISSQKPVTTECVGMVTDPLTGWEYISLFEHKVQGTAQYPTGFVCRIDGFPSVAKQDCQHTPTYSEGTWAYYQATLENGGVWKPSPVGAAMTRPVCGNYEGWRFIEAGQSTSQESPRFKPQPFECK